jgi:hypothetical protein
MNESGGHQLEINFDSPQDQQGYDQWQAHRRLAKHLLAQKLGLPIGYKVEVWLKGDIRLRGVMQLKEELLFVEVERDFNLELVVDGVSFTAAEIASCIRLDS